MTTITAQQICDDLVEYATTGVTSEQLLEFAEQRFGGSPWVERGIALAKAELRKQAARDLAEAEQLERYGRARARCRPDAGC